MPQFNASNESSKKIERSVAGTTPPGGMILELIQYNAEEYHFFDQTTISALLSEIKPEYTNWINLDGLFDAQAVSTLGHYFNLHPLLLDDVLTDSQPKFEAYDDYLFFTMKMLYRINPEEIEYEQISFVLGSNYLVSFQEKEGDPFHGIREHLKQGTLKKLRNLGPDYLLCRLIDVIIEKYYEVFEEIERRIELVEDEIMNNRVDDRAFLKIQTIRKELIYMRKSLYPLGESLKILLKGDLRIIKPEIVRYYSDICDQVVHLTDSIDTYRDLISGLMDMCMNMLNTKMNEVIKVLTVISTIFMPLTFIVGLYGMNFRYMPELEWPWGYPAVMLFMLALLSGMVFFFRRKKWF